MHLPHLQFANEKAIQQKLSQQTNIKLKYVNKIPNKVLSVKFITYRFS